MIRTDEEASSAFDLIKLLELHCACQDQWEIHYGKIFDGTFTKKQEAADHERLLEEVTRPMLKKSREEGFEFGTLMDIIPPNFKTTKEDRDELMAELKDWVDVEYDLEIPF